MTYLHMNDPNSPSRKTEAQIKKELYECRCGFQTHSEEKLETHYDNAHDDKGTLRLDGEIIATLSHPPQSTQPDKLDEILSELTPCYHVNLLCDECQELVTEAKQALIAHFLEIVEGSKPDFRLEEEASPTASKSERHDIAVWNYGVQRQNIGISDYHTNLINNIKGEK